ncbi:MAG: hypothetical protein JNL10_05875, partial [Verrucomicrobiales bacterium]|nr:hypothetical protein [Verrucomicrobiales bacterium]
MDSPSRRFSHVHPPARAIALLTLLLLMLPARSQDAQQILWHLPSEETPLVIGRSYPLEGSSSSGLPVVYRVAKGPATLTDGRVMATNVGTIVVVAEQPGNGAFLPASLSRTFNRSVIETVLAGQLDPAAKVRVANGLVFLAGQDLAIVRVTDPQSPQVLGRLPLNSPATDVEVVGSYAVLTSADGLLVVDVGDPRQPRLLTTTSTSGPALAVSLELPTVAVATGTTGVDIFTWLPPAAPQRITTLDSGENPLNAQSLLLHHQIAYVANFARSVHVYDLTNPGQPLSVGEIAGFGGLAALAAAGPHLHVLDPVAYWVFQLQPPALPFQVGSGSSAQDWFELVLSGDRAFAVGNQYGFRAFDLVDSIHPWLVGETGFDFFPVGLDLQGNLAFVTFGAQPTQIRRLREGLRQPVEFQIHDVHVTNGPITFTLTATAASGLPATFRLLEGPATISGSELTVTNAGMLVVQADVPGNEQFYPASVTATFFAYKLPQDVRFEPPASVTLGSGGLDLFLFAEASSGLPVDFEVLSGPGRIEGGRLTVTDVGSVRVRAWQPGNLAYYESPTVERTILVTDPPSFTRQPSPANVSAGSPVTLQAAVATPAASTFQWYLDGVAVAGSTLEQLELPSVTPARTGLYHLVATHAGRGSATSSIVSVSVDLPGSELVLRPRGSLPLRGRPNRANPARIELQDHYAFVTELQLPDLRIYDVANPEGLQQVATLPFLGPGHEDSALKDGFLYLAERLNGLAIVDVRNPRRPVRHSLYRLPGNRTDVVTIEIRGELAYVGNGAHGLAILNLSNPTEPVLVGSLDTSGLGAGVRLRDDLAYVADWSGGLKVVNVADPANPFLMTRHPGTDSAGQSYYDLFLNDRAAYVADTAGGLLVLDLAGFPTLRRVGLIPGSIWGLDGGGRFLATADNSTSGATPRAGIRLFDIATPTNAIPLGRFADWGTMDGVRLQGNRLFVAGTRFGIIDLDFPTRPPEITEAPVAISGRLQQPARLEVRAQGAEPLTYQWFHGGESVPGATNAVLHFDALQIADGGSYVVEVRNPLGTARSDPV